MIAPFPWHALPRVSAAHVRAMSRVQRAYPTVRVRDIAAQLSSLIGHPVEITVRRTAAGRVELGARGGVITLGDGDRTFALELESELALAIASSLAGGKLPKIARGRTIDPEVLGATAGIAQWLARQSGVDVSIVDDSALRGLECATFEVSVRVGVLRTAARLGVAIPELDRSPAMPAMETLHRLGELPLRLSAVVGYGTARAGDLSPWMVSDVVLVDHRLDGCALVAPNGRSGVAARVVEPDSSGNLRVRLGEDRVALAAPTPPNEEPAAMTDETGATMQLPALQEGSRMAEDLAELPVTVRIELGEAALSAREWAAISAGDVVVLDRRVGDPVSLRIGGKVLARGELVEVDGAIGVRITERTS